MKFHQPQSPLTPSPFLSVQGHWPLPVSPWRLAGSDEGIPILEWVAAIFAPHSQLACPPKIPRYDGRTDYERNRCQ